MNTQEIQAKYLKLHDDLGTKADAIDKAQFDIDHQKLWSDCDAELKGRMDDLIAKINPTPNEQLELDNLLTMFPKSISNTLKEQYQAATTQAQKLSIIAKRLGLE